jgi:ubiquinone/menaquinone biosynthesis C-methylase UbiE
MSSNVDHNLQIVDQFSKQAESYARVTGSLAPPRPAALQMLLQPHPNDLALEVCCGPGALALALAPAVRHVTGMDLTPAMLEQAKLRHASSGIENVDWINGDINDIPFEDARFGIVMCSSAFHHLVQPQRAFREMLRVCRPGGRIMIKDVTPAPEKVERYDATEKLRDPSHTHALTVDELRALGSGLAVEELSFTTSVTPPVPLEAVLATSFPTECSMDDLRSLFLEDARCGEDRLGYGAALIDDAVHIRFRMSTALWRRREP